MTARKLRSVKVDEKPVVATPLTVGEAAASGDHRALLVALRERIATTVGAADCPPRDLASLSRRLQEIAKELDQLDARARKEAKEAAGLDGDQDWNAEAI